MKNFWKLTNFELNRFSKIYFILIGLTLAMQTIGIVLLSSSYMSDVEEQLALGSTLEWIKISVGTFSFSSVTSSYWFGGPIVISIVSLLIYVFFIWYRDWFGKNTFIYRLLMLPTARINVFFAKATTIFLMVFGLISLQLVFILMENELLKLMVSETFREDQSLNQIIFSFDYMGVLYPTSIIQFFINYGIGFMAVFVVFTGVLFERCFRLKGILFGILFAGVALFVFISPVLLQVTILEEFFYPNEIFILMVITGLMVTTGSIWMSHYLLNKKIRV
ncbi:hypothetical protein [Paucisalibacillus sp. EB02]|uniref:hypothetical protein n=1 Tax=Paucisalibacillus sp. EB02 TaxID=1347087 RepID=UPI0004B36D06|nr:hypothetical protein [Paucisalibacillus sp. EB02]